MSEEAPQLKFVERLPNPPELKILILSRLKGPGF